jgi:NAD-dependent dihydropyrimidine dehydrogenase PreA subunit
MAIKIDQQRCDGCAACMDACNVGAIYLVDKKAYIDQSLCTLCGICIEVCPVQAIQSVESVVVQQKQLAEIQPAKPSVLPTIKAALVTLGSSLLPVLISKIGDAIISTLESKPDQSALPKRKAPASGRQSRKRHRGGA